MSKRSEPFAVALQSLRERLRQGGFGYERRLAAAEIAEALALSPTPVREALARLAGEGLVEERRGQGYFVPRPGAAEVADLYRLSQAHVLIALEPRLTAPAAAEAGETQVADAPADRCDQLLAAVVARAGSWALVQAHRRVQGRLAPIRRHEPLVLGGLEAEARALAAAAEGDRPVLAAAVRGYHRRRIRIADRLAGLLERRPEVPPL